MLKLKSALFLLLIILFNSHSSMAMANTGDDFLAQIAAIRNLNYRNGGFNERLYKYKDNFIKIHNFTLNYGSKVLEKISNGESLTGHELTLIHETLSVYSFLAKYSNDFLKDMAPKKKSKFLTSPEIDKLEKNLQWLEFKTLLLQYFKNVYMVFYKNETLRRIIKNQIRSENNQLYRFNEVADSVLNRSYRRNLELALKLYLSKEKIILKETALNTYTDSIKATIPYLLMKSKVGLKEFASQEGLRANAFDNLRDGFSALTHSLSFAFGSVAGNVSWRKGYLNNDHEALNHIKENLKPLDLLFEKRGFVFTDLTIPGNWGHVAVWLGTEEQLKEKGLWDTAEISPYQDKIQKGYSIFQVRRWGLEFSTLENFMKLDEISIVRHENIFKRSQNAIKRVYKNLFSQIGKSYDFGFDVMTTNEITCTEIITLSYGDIVWPTTFTLGRVTISPDDMAEISLQTGSPFKTITYLRGQKDQGALYLNNNDYATALGFKTIIKNDLLISLKPQSQCDNNNDCKLEYHEIPYRGSKL
ncbi:MAG: hypothetical protein HN576_02005 [Bacteriovoracaceae bacterium]|jgi:hypothetical protein|nr:hypothetical protein [Bacteriovoracaceae bacterium]